VESNNRVGVRLVSFAGPLAVFLGGERAMNLAAEIARWSPGEYLSSAHQTTFYANPGRFCHQGSTQEALSLRWPEI